MVEGPAERATETRRGSLESDWAAQDAVTYSFLSSAPPRDQQRILNMVVKYAVGWKGLNTPKRER